MVALRWGIAGCGWVTRDFVGPAIKASCNGTLAGLYDPSSAALTRAAAVLGPVPATRDADSFFGDLGLGAVYVAAPNHAHRALVEAAARQGLPALCEKPMALYLSDAKAMVSACRQAGVLYATAFDRRFHAAHVAARRMVAAGTLGQLTALRIVYACWLDDCWTPDNWRIDPALAGGGALFDLAPHGLDLASMIVGEPLEAVAALGQGVVHDYARGGQVEDGALLIARSGSGVLVQMHVAYNCPETLPRRRLEIVGTRGQLVALNTMGQTPGGSLSFIDAATGAVSPIAVAGSDRSPFLAQVETFAGYVLAGSLFPFTPERDLHIAALLDRAQSQARVSLSLETA